jgi:hypothetical protein
LYRALLEDEDFRAGRLDVEMLDRKLGAGKLRVEESEGGDVAVIAAALEFSQQLAALAGSPFSADGSRDAWRETARREGLRGNRWS